MSKNFKQFSKAIWEKYEVVEEENKPTNPELWARAKSMAKKKFDVYPSAYANGWASKWYKSKGGGWKSVSEAVEPEKKDEYDGEVDMAKNQLKRIISHAQHFHDMLTDKDQNLPEWVQSKVTKAEDYISTAHDYMMGEMQEATYTAVHAKHGKKTIQADSTYGAAKAAASHWNTGKKGTQGIDVHLHTDKPKAYTEAVVRLDPKSFLKVKGPSSAYDAGYTAAKSGKKYGENPHTKGSKEHLDWSKAHNQARANKIHGEDVEKLHEVSPNTKIQNILKKIQDRKNIKPVSDKAYADHVKKSVAARDEYVKKEREAGRTPLYKLSTEDSNIPALMKKPVEEGYYKSQQIDKMEDERLAKQKKASTGFAKGPHPDLLKKAREWDKKHPLPKWQDKTPKGYGPNESVKINTIKEIHRNAKMKKKQKPETFEAEPELTSDIQLNTGQQ